MKPNTLKHLAGYTFLAGVLAFSSCNKDMDIPQKSQITSTSMWKTESDAVGALNGMYVQFRNCMATNIAYWGDYRSGLYGPGKLVDAGLYNLFNNSLVRDNTGTDWRALYTTINAANLLIKYTPKIAFVEESKRNSILANAYFVRAMSYFYIARIWGDAPLLTEGFESEKQADLYPSRSPVAEVFNQVESDINEAVSLMPATVTDKYTASFASVQLLKADYFLWKAKRLNGGTEALEKAKTAVDLVLGGANTLQNDFASLFSIANKTNSEIIFSVHFRRDEFTGGHASLYLIPAQYVVDKSLIENPIKTGSSQQYVTVTPDFNDFLTADATDTRANVSVMTYVEGAEQHRWINKLAGEWTNNTRFFNSDLIIYRLAEAYYLKAEIENELDNTVDAIGWLNKVVKRAYKVDAYYDTNLSKAAVKERIIDEALREFVAEGKSWWIMLRQGVAFERIQSLAGKEGVKNITLWPVTSASINSNPNIVQTEGYN